MLRAQLIERHFIKRI